MTHGFKNGRLEAELGTLFRTGVGEWILFDDGTDEWQIFSSDGSPEGVVAADTGSLATDITNGELYIKTTDTVATGWVKIGASSGDVAGPGFSTDNAIARFDGTTGKIIQNSVAILSDAGVLTGLTQLDVDNLRLDGNTISSTDTNGDINLTPDGTGSVVIDTPAFSNLTGIVTANAASDATASAVDQHAVLIGGASNLVADVGPLTNGQLVIGSTGVAPVAATLTAGTNVSISNAAGSITINANVGAQVVSVTALTSAASPYTVLAADYYMTCNTSGGVLTIRLPDAPTTGRIFIIKDANGTADTNNITVTTVGGAVTIDGGTSFVMNTEYEAISLLFNGTSYEVH